MNTLETPFGTTLYFIGPPLKQGPLPTLFYFSLSGEESLTLAPYNTPITFLDETKLRIFSIDLPAHGEGFNKHKAIGIWAQWMEEGKHPLMDCIEEICKSIDYLFEQEIASSIATAGLSRGAFIATHVASNDPRVKGVLGLAPLTDLSYSPDFARIKDHPHVQAMALQHLLPSLLHIPIRFSIGNQDTAVGTDTCFSFIFDLASLAHENGTRSPHVELTIHPSIGHRGHGTPRHIFESGAHWIQDLL